MGSATRPFCPFCLFLLSEAGASGYFLPTGGSGAISSSDDTKSVGVEAGMAPGEDWPTEEPSAFVKLDNIHKIDNIQNPKQFKKVFRTPIARILTEKKSLPPPPLEELPRQSV
jgi:hypothetical protein